MASSREHFALDWIKSDLLETLNQARVALDEYAEQGADETRLRACLTNLHQVHGTLVMLELEGVTLLADHLEQLAQGMLSGAVKSRAADQTLMQGILELPGYLDELQRGSEDSTSAFVPLVNEIRALLELEQMPDRAGASLTQGASDDVVQRFLDIDGPGKVAKMRSAYQNVLLSILKGEERSAAMVTLGKIAAGLQRLTQGAPLERQWQAFGEFVASLASKSGALESDAVKLLRRVDLEIKNLAKDGVGALRKPVNMDLVQQLLDASAEQDYSSDVVEGLREAVTRDSKNNTLAISGRQALSSAAEALRDELSVIKDRLDLMARAKTIDLEEMRQLLSPLKQIGSTLSVLGFESSREIVSDQIDAVENLVVLGDSDPAGVQSIASALIQIDENLNSVIQGSGQSEVEQITSQAQIQVLREARNNLEQIKTAIVDFVTAHWDTRHLGEVPEALNDICGALEIIPLPRLISVLERARGYVVDKLLQGHQPDWMELDQFAEVISGADYYLERLVEENPVGTEDILQVAERSLAQLHTDGDAAVEDAAVEIETPEPVEAAASVERFAEPAEQEADQEQDAPVGEVVDEAVGEHLAEEDFSLELEEDEAFDLSSDLFKEVEGAVEGSLEMATEQPVEAGAAQAPETPVEPPVSAAAPETAAPAGPDPDMPEVDPEIVEIFVEEVDEVLETIDEWLPRWAQSLAPDEALTELRRGFHTLKGSGRIVHAVEMGELAWGIENMLNRVIDGTVQPTSQFVDVVTEARNLVPALRDAFEARRRGDLDAIGNVIERADVLSSGGTVEVEAAAPAAEIPVAAEPAAPVVETPDVIDAAGAEAGAKKDVELSFTDSEPVEVEPVEVEPFEVENEPLDDAAAEAETEDELVEAALETADSEASTEAQSLSARDLFISEAEEHLDVIARENALTPWTLSEHIARAFHTLAGSAAIAGAEQVKFLVDPAYQVVEAFRNRPPSDELKQFFLQAQSHLRACFASMTLSEEWEDPLEFVAAADDLLAGVVDKPRAAEVVLQSEKTNRLFDLEPNLHSFLEDGGQCPALLSGLSEFAELAADNAESELAGLSGALLHALTEASGAGGVTAQNGKVFSDAYESLLNELSNLAVGTAIADQGAHVAALEQIEHAVADEPVETPAEVATPVVEAVEAPLAEPRVEASESDLPAEQTDAEPAALEPAADQAASAEAASPAPSDELDVDEDLAEVFFEEAEEICEELESSLLSWSQEMDNRIYMETLLRGLHTLKGGARLCGLTDVGGMAHEFESSVIEVQNDERVINAELFTELHQRYDNIISRLSQVKEALAAGAAITAATPESPAAPADAPTAEQQPALPQANNLVDLDAAKPAATPAPAPQVAETQVVERTPQEMVRVGSGLLEQLVNLAGENSILRARIEQGMSDFTGALDEMETTIERLREQLRRLEIETETQILHRHERHEGPDYENFDPLEMDRYSQLQQLSRGLSESASDMLDLKDTLLFKARESETLLLQQARINTELQEGLMRTRMVPFSRLVPRLRRIVRQVAGELGKEVEFNVQNAEGELDRNLLERMVPPLEHMLRNAVDHGIESAEIRRNFGKPAQGRIDLRLTREGGDVVIEIIDDGAGIDVESVRAKAVERQLMTGDASMSDEEVMQFVLAPGFTTAKSVTQISGRGVGMDVVHSEVKQLGGSIGIASKTGQGTRFTLRVPFTVSVNRALMVSVADDMYAIPLNTIEGIVLLSPEKIQSLYEGDVNTFEYAGVPYRVRYLGQYLGREYHGPAVGQTSVPVVLVRSGDHSVAVHVDLVHGSREIVVKSLGPQFAGVGGISGATILGDGSVVVILDLLALIRAQRHQRQERDAVLAPAAGSPRCVLVVDDSVTVRKVTSRILERQGMDVLVAKDGIEAVAMLQERRPDVMLLDIEMPRMDGFEVARQVRHDERLDKLPIVMISSRTGDKHKEHASQLGVNKFLGKPFQENELLETIDELVTRV